MCGLKLLKCACDKICCDPPDVARVVVFRGCANINGEIQRVIVERTIDKNNLNTILEKVYTRDGQEITDSYNLVFYEGNCEEEKPTFTQREYLPTLYIDIAKRTDMTIKDGVNKAVDEEGYKQFVLQNGGKLRIDGSHRLRYIARERTINGVSLNPASLLISFFTLDVITGDFKVDLMNGINWILAEDVVKINTDHPEFDESFYVTFPDSWETLKFVLEEYVPIGLARWQIVATYTIEMTKESGAAPPRAVVVRRKMDGTSQTEEDVLHAVQI